MGNQFLNRDPLDLIERNLIAGAVIELGRARAFVRGHGLSMLKRTTVRKVSGDAGRAERVIADRRDLVEATKCRRGCPAQVFRNTPSFSHVTALCRRDD